jgi:hypothetical protein
MNDALSAAHDILLKYRCDAQAAVIAQLRELQVNDPGTFVATIQGVSMWGGAGAVWEARLDAPNIAAAEREHDTCRFRDAIVAIARVMDTLGIGTPRSRGIAATLQCWNAWQVSGGAAPFTRPIPPPDLEAEIVFLPSSQGGRSTAVRSGYRPMHDFRHPDGLFDAIHEYPDVYWVLPGETARAHLWFVRRELLAGRIPVGGRFTVQEGLRVIGNGRVTRVMNDVLRHGA